MDAFLVVYYFYSLLYSEACLKPSSFLKHSFEAARMTTEICIESKRRITKQDTLRSAYVSRVKRKISVHSLAAKVSKDFIFTVSSLSLLLS